MTALLEQFAPDSPTRMVVETAVPRPPYAVYDAFRRVLPSDMRLASWLSWLRSLPARVPAGPEQPLLELLLEFGWVPLADRPGQEVVMGLVGRVWRADFGVRRLGSAADFLAFAEPGYAKIVVSYRFAGEGGGTRLICETRVATTDEASARHFRWYWRVIRPGAWLTVRSGLAGIARLAMSDRAAA